MLRVGRLVRSVAKFAGQALSRMAGEPMQVAAAPAAGQPCIPAPSHFEALFELLLPGRVDSSEARIQLAEELRRAAAVVEAHAASPAPPPLVGPRSAGAPSAHRSKKARKREPRPFDITRYPHRHVALEVMYAGENYLGFACQAGLPATVEHQLLVALRVARMVAPTATLFDCDYSRCGRTDKGVSALRQVIALRLRSKCPLPAAEQAGVAVASPGPAREGGGEGDASAELSADADDAEATETAGAEIDYVGVLNRLLPEDIRVLGWSYVAPPPAFSARFACRGREYRYYFLAEPGLDVEAMRAAAAVMVGEHDFRNFCRMDAANVKSFVRKLEAIDIVPVASASGACGWPLWALEIRGSSFLWHQVRCMASVLFMVGRGDETLDTISWLLDTARCPAKPQYLMAPEGPLLLYRCVFDSLTFERPTRSLEYARQALVSLMRRAQLRAAVLTACVSEVHGPAFDVPGAATLLAAAPVAPFDWGGLAVARPRHVPLRLRPVEVGFEARKANLVAAGKRRAWDSDGSGAEGSGPE